MSPSGGRGQTRAVYPDQEAAVRPGGVPVRWESYGRGEPAILFMPTWSIIHSRCWKQQIPDFARRHRVLTFDPRGNGGSGRPADPAAYSEEVFAADALAVMDAAGVGQVVVVGWSLGAQRALVVAGEHPDRVRGLVLVAPLLEVDEQPGAEREAAARFTADLGVDEGWDRYNAHSWRRDYAGFVRFFFSQVFSEPHSTKPIEDCVGWGLETDAETLITAEVPGISAARVRELCARVRCPVLVVHGDQDAIVPHAVGVEAARLTGGRIVTFAGSGHGVPARDPVRFNLELRAFIAVPPPRTRRWTRARARRKRALYISSPIGLGHAQRDIAIAGELRKLHPGLEIDWLAQHPVTTVLEASGERIHPASAHLASESGHLESESAGHDLHAFQAIRRMDEILLANFMVICDVAREEDYDLWIGDEAWELDYYLHENPELKSAAYAWFTDFVGWLPMPGSGDREAFLTADYNAEMIGQIARFPRVRDRAIFVGDPEDIVPDAFGPGLPPIRGWTERHYDFAGYITGFDPRQLPDREQLGYHDGERVVIVTVGGSGVGGPLLRRVIAAFPEAQARVPGLRMIVVTGPRIDPASLPLHDGLEIWPYVHQLHRHLAACDLAVVQGGLTTAMELTAARRPFLYFPLARHFEQNLHVRHRLDRYRAGRYMNYHTAGPAEIAAAIAAEIGRDVDYLPVATDGAARAANLLASLL
jgi:pimeloyl-ACP methyl ester carboxylesterase/predicted glycosyltransferase